MLRIFLAVMLALCCAPPGGLAQATPERVAFTSAPKISQPLPFRVGESLSYEVSFSRFIFSGTVGELRLSVAKAGEAGNQGLLDLRAEVNSKGFFPKLFGVKVKDKFNSTVSSDDLGLHVSSKLIEEGSIRREQKSVINRAAGRVTYTERDLANEKAGMQIKEAASPSWIQDMLSSCYFVRSQKLGNGDVIKVPISDGGEVFNIEVVVAGREEVKVDAGKFKAIKLIAKIFDGYYIKRSGEMFVWVSDDARRIPVRAKIKTSGSSITVELKQVK
ncbi:MAG TPA: DUF3108 domain-containing protein [Blastocatellia bacterium]|jgi:hypothetical protein